MKKPSSKIRDEIARLQEQLRQAETREAERIGRIALKAGLGEIEIDEGQLQVAFEELARLLIGEGDMDGILRLGQKYPTAGLAVIDFALEDWADVAHKSGRLERFVTPKSLGNGEDD